MGEIAVYILLACTAGISIIQPWVGVVVSYLFIILVPQNIWWWAFDGVRPVLWVMLPTFIGFIGAWFRGYLDFSLLWNKRNFWLFVLWISFVLSYFFGPYVKIQIHRFENAERILYLVNKIFIFYFIACICIDHEKKLKALNLVMVVSVIYLTYWQNGQYLFQGHSGRLGGPVSPYGGGIYHDQNAFALFFVVGLPFLYYYSLYLKQKLLRYALWLIIPLGWHAVFLTGSRGGLLGLVATILTVCLRSQKKSIGILIVLSFLGAFFWQAGPLMLKRSETISDYHSDKSAEGRLDAWQAAIKMIQHHPLIGVGLASFGPAFPDYSKTKPREAHNTFFQITAESGILAGLAYIMVVWITFQQLRKNSRLFKFPKSPTSQKANFLPLFNEAVLASFIGMVTCSLFLSLQIYELFYFLCLLTNSLTFLAPSEELSSSSSSSISKSKYNSQLSVISMK